MTASLSSAPSSSRPTTLISHGKFGRTFILNTMHSGRVLYIEDPIGKIFVAKKYLVTPSVFKLQKRFLRQNGVEFNKKSKSELIILWPVFGR